MFKTLKIAAFAASCLVALVASAAAQATTGTVNMSATSSKFVEINSGGAVSLTGNSGGGVSVDGTVNNPLAVVIDLGEVGPSNLSNFVVANVPLKIRSNATYSVSASAVVSGSGSTPNRLLASDFGFGLVVANRSGLGVNVGGSDTNNTAGDPTAAASAINGSTGRFEFTAVRGNLGDFASPVTAVSGSQIMNAVPRANNNGLLANAIFAVKPQFYENGTTSVTVTFTATTP